RGGWRRTRDVTPKNEETNVGHAYRLGLDIGTNSIGWAAVTLNEAGRPNGLLALGARIFSDGRNPKDGSSLAVQRRVPRGMRRRRDRYLRRRDDLMELLIALNLMPPDEAERHALVTLDPYELRAKALHEPLKPCELGRALFHLDQRRGFKSNRKTDSDKDNKLTNLTSQTPYRYNPGYNDHSVLSLEGLRWADPTKFVNDWFMNAAPQPHWFFDLITYWGQSAGLLSQFYFVYWIAGLVACGFATALIAK